MFSHMSREKYFSRKQNYENMLDVLSRAGHDVVGLDSYFYERCRFGPERRVVPAIRKAFDRAGFSMVRVGATQSFAASRTDLQNPWIDRVASSIRAIRAAP